ncbi:hypothetical protein FH972_025714 [Carpinus fangiana]|uniref:Uncharacterized protein n=1 Tax=Carpinus fangiana TaxID=176857 RepID=A0A5N6L4E6_9ROSI|nr:hypothetical protein FH972_025714 [Carpinus fangiana]
MRRVLSFESINVTCVGCRPIAARQPYAKTAHFPPAGLTKSTSAVLKHHSTPLHTDFSRHRPSRCRYARSTYAPLPSPPEFLSFSYVRSTAAHAAVDDASQQQVFPYQGQAGQGPEAEPPHSPVDSSSDWQHHPLQRQAEALAQDPHRIVVVGRAHAYTTVDAGDSLQNGSWKRTGNNNTNGDMDLRMAFAGRTGFRMTIR